MEMEPGSVEKPVRKLRKSLKSLPRELPAKDVHKLRTQARRLEAIVAALMLDRKKPSRRLLKTVESMRKAAGEVRDLDVLVANAMTLPGRRNDSVVRLLDHLAGMRMESARELLDTLAEQRKDARRSLKHFLKRIGKKLSKERPGSSAESSQNCREGEAAQKIIAELNCWPELNAENLHSFRIRLKELLYILQLARNAEPGFVDALSTVKEEIGDWHDWQQLEKIAQKRLDSQKDRALLKKIEEICKQKFSLALVATDAMRQQHLKAHLQT